jgi:hypothetical protein
MASEAVVRRVPKPMGAKRSEWIINTRTTGSTDIKNKPVGGFWIDQGVYDAMSAAEKTAYNAATITAITAVTGYYGTWTAI